MERIERVDQNVVADDIEYEARAGMLYEVAPDVWVKLRKSTMELEEAFNVKWTRLQKAKKDQDKIDAVIEAVKLIGTPEGDTKLPDSWKAYTSQVCGRMVFDFFRFSMRASVRTPGSSAGSTDNTDSPQAATEQTA